MVADDNGTSVDSVLAKMQNSKRLLQFRPPVVHGGRRVAALTMAKGRGGHRNFTTRLRRHGARLAVELGSGAAAPLGCTV